jgi:excisionase family DNA binding protein
MKMYMTIEEVAQSLRVTVPTVRCLQEGRFAPAIEIGRRVLWDEEALTAWLEANREASAR